MVAGKLLVTGLAGALAGACGSQSAAPVPSAAAAAGYSLDDAVKAARADAGRRTGTAAGALVLLSAETVTWSDGAWPAPSRTRRIRRRWCRAAGCGCVGRQARWTTTRAHAVRSCCVLRDGRWIRCRAAVASEFSSRLRTSRPDGNEKRPADRSAGRMSSGDRNPRRRSSRLEAFAVRLSQRSDACLGGVMVPSSPIHGRWPSLRLTFNARSHR